MLATAPIPGNKFRAVAHYRTNRLSLRQGMTRIRAKLALDGANQLDTSVVSEPQGLFVNLSSEPCDASFLLRTLGDMH